MKALFRILPLAMLFLPGAQAQAPLAAGRTTPTHLYLGYSYFGVSIPSSSSFGVHGFDANATFDLLPRLGLELNGSYGRKPDMLGSGHHYDILTYMAGPVFYPVQRRGYVVRIYGLVGGARQTGVNNNIQGGLWIGIFNRLAWAAGASADYKLDRHWSIRVGADYLHASFFDTSAKSQAQDNFRATAGLVYSFGESRRR